MFELAKISLTCKGISEFIEKEYCLRDIHMLKVDNYKINNHIRDYIIKQKRNLPLNEWHYRYDLSHQEIRTLNSSFVKKYAYAWILKVQYGRFITPYKSENKDDTKLITRSTKRIKLGQK